MAKETKSIQVVQGRRAEAADKDKYEKKEEVKKVESSEAGGRSLSYQHVICPNCGTVRTIVYSDNTYNSYTCSNCGVTYIA
jgi:predicted RNA-binding Zn-ribbon protein involved in translation (DUF1610 family)